MVKTFDIVIIGNGAIGMTLALALSDASSSTSIAVVGPSSRFGAGSLVAGAMLNVWAEIESGALEDSALAARFSLPHNALALWPRHLDMLQARSGFSIPSSFETFVICGSRSPVAEQRAFSYMIKCLRRSGTPYELVDGAELAFLDPDPLSRPTQAAKVPDGSLDSRTVMAALDAILDGTRSVTKIDSTVTSLAVEAGGDKAVSLANGEKLRSKTIVLANGAYAQNLVDTIPALRHSVPRLLFGGGSSLDIAFPPEVQIEPSLGELKSTVRTMDRGGACGMHLIPLGRRNYYFGASSGIWPTPEPLPQVHAISFLVRGITAEFHSAFFRATMSIRGPGYRPVSMDSFPLLGESEIAGVWFCNGLKRDGFTCAPYLAREFVRAMGGSASALPEMFKPCRPLISYRDRKAATAAALDATLGSEQTHGLSLPFFRREKWRAHHLARIESIYSKRRIEAFGIHPELTHFYESDELYQQVAHPRSVY